MSGVLGTERQRGGTLSCMVSSFVLRLVDKAHAWEEGGGALRLGDVADVPWGGIRVQKVAVVGVSFRLESAIARAAAALAQTENARSGWGALLGNVRGAWGVDAVDVVWRRRCGGVERVLAA